MIELGMPADDVLMLPGYAKKNAVMPPKQIGKDEHGLIVKWFYPDMDITFRRGHFDGELCYRVSEISYLNINKDSIVCLDRRLPKDTEDMAFIGLRGAHFELSGRDD